MNSSSAFSNALTVPAIQPASHFALARNSNDDSNLPGFDKAMAEVRSEREDKVREPCAKRPGGDKPAKVKAAPDDAAANSDKPLAASPKKTDKVEKKAEPDAAEETTEDIHNSETPQPLIALDVLAVPAPVETSVAVALDPTAMAVVAEGAEAEASPLPGTAATLPATEVLANLDVAQQPAQELESTPPLEAIGESVIALADPVLAAAANPVATAATVPETIAALGLAPVKETEVKLDKLVSAADVAGEEGSLLAEDDSASSDPKLVFEKMLQAIASNTGANGSAAGDAQKAPDLAATIASLAAGSADSAAPAPGLESLSRSVEAQLPAARSFIVQTAVPVSVGQPTWSQAVGEKVLWLAAQNVQSAEIRLDPPELGPMMVKVSVHQEQTSISFTSHNAGVRELLDQSMGRLRDMFNEQGLNLVNVDVSDKSFQRQQGDGSEQQGQGARAEPEEEESLQAVSSIVHQRLVDHYA